MKLQSCCSASSCEVLVNVGAKPVHQLEPLNCLTAFKGAGVHRLQLVWWSGQVVSGKHVHALGAVFGQDITHLTLVPHSSIPDEVWSTLWAAFPRLQSLTIHAPSLGNITEMVKFCEAAPHALHLSLSHNCYNEARGQLDSDLRSTRVLITTHQPSVGL
jgi:hypothetical protein